MATATRHIATGQIPVQQAQLVNAGNFPADTSSAEALGAAANFANTMTELALRQRDAQDSLAATQASKGRIQMELEMQQAMLDEPDTDKWEEIRSKLSAKYGAAYTSLKMSDKAREKQDIEQQAANESLRSRVQLSATTRNVNDAIFVGGAHFNDVYVHDDGSKGDALEIEQAMKGYQEALELKYSKDVADTHMDKTLERAIKDREMLLRNQEIQQKRIEQENEAKYIELTESAWLDNFINGVQSEQEIADSEMPTDIKLEWISRVRAQNKAIEKGKEAVLDYGVYDEVQLMIEKYNADPSAKNKNRTRLAIADGVNNRTLPEAQATKLRDRLENVSNPDSPLKKIEAIRGITQIEETYDAFAQALEKEDTAGKAKMLSDKVRAKTELSDWILKEPRTAAEINDEVDRILNNIAEEEVKNELADIFNRLSSPFGVLFQRARTLKNKIGVDVLRTVPKDVSEMTDEEIDAALRE